MEESQLGRVEVKPSSGPIPVKGVAQDRQAYPGEMGADLMAKALLYRHEQLEAALLLAAREEPGGVKGSLGGASLAAEAGDAGGAGPVGLEGRIDAGLRGRSDEGAKAAGIQGGPRLGPGLSLCPVGRGGRRPGAGGLKADRGGSSCSARRKAKASGLLAKSTSPEVS
jgi:hypothetical protein